MLRKVILPILAALSFSLAHAEGEQQFASIGDLKLVSGATLRDVRVGYRTFGKLNPKKDNVVLFPTWYLGKSEDLKGSFGDGDLIDSNRYFVIAVDALGNGISTSPSNSKTQRDAAFPTITIRDMVESQHRMLLGMGIRHLRAVSGISMGGIQTFQWITAYPTFMDRAMPIVGSPRPSSYDLMFYTSGLKAIQASCRNRSARGDLITSFADFFYLSLNTPAYYVKHTKREGAVESLTGFENALMAWNPYDMAADLSALIHQDIFQDFGGSEKRTAAAVRAKVLVIVASQDHCVNPEPALHFAKILRAKTLVMRGEEGHSSPGPNTARLSSAIAAFLK